MLSVKQWTEGRRMRPVERPASRKIRRRTGLHRETIRRALWSSTPPGYSRPSRGLRRRRLNRPSPLWPRPTGSALATTGGLLVNPKPTPRGGQCSTLDTYPAATGWSRFQPALTRLAFSLEEALWIKRSQRVRSFGERFAANVVSTSNSTADKRFLSAKGISSERHTSSSAPSTSAETVTGFSHSHVQRSLGTGDRGPKRASRTVGRA